MVMILILLTMKCAKTYFDADDWRIFFLAGVDALQHMGTVDARKTAVWIRYLRCMFAIHIRVY
jgi:hypothetical protein